MSDFYTTPYRVSLQWAGQHLSDPAFKTYMMLMSHANDLGVCFPGFRRLGELTLHELARVNDEMREIMRLDLARQVEPAQQDRYGRWTPALYQINPQALRIAEKHIDAALVLWTSIEQTIEQKVPVQKLASKVTQESESESESESAESTRVNKQQQQQTASAPEGEIQFNAGQLAAWQFQRAAPSGSALRPTEQKTDVPPATPPAAAGAPVKYREIVAVREQLPFAHEEDLAQIVSQKTHMTVRLARGLIATYAYQPVAAALESEFVRFADKPAGALRHLLEKQQISDETLNLDQIRLAGPPTEQLSEMEF